MLAAFAPVEPLEDMGQVLRIDSGTVVGDGDRDGVGQSAAGQADLAVGVADGVGDQVAEQPLGVLLPDRQEDGGNIPKTRS